MSTEMLSTQMKENSFPEATYPELPIERLLPPNTALARSANQLCRTPPNTGRKRSPPLAILVQTPSRFSFATQMTSHFANSAPPRTKTKIPCPSTSGEEGSQTTKRTRVTGNSCRQSPTLSSSSEDENPLDDLEGAIATAIPETPTAEQRRKTLYIPSPHYRAYDSDTTSEAWTGDDVFLPPREGPRRFKSKLSERADVRPAPNSSSLTPQVIRTSRLDISGQPKRPSRFLMPNAKRFTTRKCFACVHTPEQEGQLLARASKAGAVETEDGSSDADIKSEGDTRDNGPTFARSDSSGRGILAFDMVVEKP